MDLCVDIHGEQVPLKVEYVEFWLAEFIEDWKCPVTYLFHPKGDTARVPGNPHVGDQTFMIMGTRHYGSEHKVPFSVLKFRHIKHTIYTLRHRTTEITPDERADSS